MPLLKCFPCIRREKFIASWNKNLHLSVCYFHKGIPFLSAISSVPVRAVVSVKVVPQKTTKLVSAQNIQQWVVGQGKWIKKMKMVVLNHEGYKCKT